VPKDLSLFKLLPFILNKERNAGVLLFIGVFLISMAILITEALRPTYSLSLDSISSLGIGPNGEIFYYSILLLGALLMISGAILLSGKKKEAWQVSLILVGVGAFGVGIFPYHVNYPLHSYFGFNALIFGEITAILFVTHKGTLLRVFSPIVGILVLVSIFLYARGMLYGLGYGGMDDSVPYSLLVPGTLRLPHESLGVI
jgi:hypothetical membrane protein